MKIKNEKKLTTIYDAYVILLGDAEAIEKMPQALDAFTKQLLKADKISSDKETYYTSSANIEGKIVELVYIGLGNEETYSKAATRKSIGKAIKFLKGQKVHEIGLFAEALFQFEKNNKAISRSLAEWANVSVYEFNDYKSNAKELTISQITLVGEGFDEGAIAEGIILGEATKCSRALTNSPANIMTPLKLAEEASRIGTESGFVVEVFEEDTIKALEMNAYLAVAKASSEKPKLIVMRYQGAKESSKTLGLVGKGLTYDSGGLSIKPTAGMVTMKNDMGGASAVIGAMKAIAQMKLDVNVTAVVAACENMIAGNGYKPGDILTSMAGKTIFIGNTDAEGRLTLVDAVHYIIEKEKVDYVIDIATLTGAALHCLGHEAAALLSSHDDFYTMVEKSAHKAEENVWRMPIFEGYKSLLKHEEADLNNAAGQPGMITAGLFIGEFVQDKPWVHMDIAGTAYQTKAKDYLSYGGTGYGVKTLYYVAKKLAD